MRANIQIKVLLVISLLVPITTVFGLYTIKSTSQGLLDEQLRKAQIIELYDGVISKIQNGNVNKEQTIEFFEASKRLSLSDLEFEKATVHAVDAVLEILIIFTVIQLVLLTLTVRKT